MTAHQRDAAQAVHASDQRGREAGQPDIPDIGSQPHLKGEEDARNGRHQRRGSPRQCVDAVNIDAALRRQQRVFGHAPHLHADRGPLQQQRKARHRDQRGRNDRNIDPADAQTRHHFDRSAELAEIFGRISGLSRPDQSRDGAQHNAEGDRGQHAHSDGIACQRTHDPEVDQGAPAPPRRPGRQ